jgi:uncharacterized membrane protein
MKKYFVTGLVLLLPLAVTVLLVKFLFNLLTDPFVGVVQASLEHYGFMAQRGGLLGSPQFIQFLSQLLILVVLFVVTVGLGILTRWFFVHWLLRVGEFILQKIPFVSSIYGTVKDVINTIFSSGKGGFKQVVMVPYPKLGTYSMGFMTQRNLKVVREGKETGMVAVFIPTTPNPTSGFLVMFDVADVIFLDMKVEDAFKYIISCGVIASPMNRITAPSEET